MMPELQSACGDAYRVLWHCQTDSVIEEAGLQCRLPAHSVQHADISNAGFIFEHAAGRQPTPAFFMLDLLTYNLVSLLCLRIPADGLQHVGVAGTGLALQHAYVMHDTLCSACPPLQSCYCNAVCV